MGALPMPGADLAQAGDDELVRAARAGTAEALRIMIKRNNQRLYRLARAVLKDDSEAEDVLQEAYVRAFTHLDQFRGEAGLSTWLARIVINEAIGRLRRERRRRSAAAAHGVEADIIPFPRTDRTDPERTMAQRQILDLVEHAADALPPRFRLVFMARIVEGMSVEETAQALGIRPETVKTRLHRARAMLRREIDQQVGPVLLDAFPFLGRRCDRLTEAVLRRLGG